MEPNVFDLAREERERQQSVEGYTPEMDDNYESGELAAAAGCYATAAWDLVNGFDPEGMPMEWPDEWAAEMWKPGHNPKRCIVKAMALLAAEYERLKRIDDEMRNVDPVDSEGRLIG